MSRPKAGRLYLARHCEPEPAYRGPYNVMPGPPLSSGGRAMAGSLGAAFDGLAVADWVSSSFERAKETAEILAHGRKVRTDRHWNEKAPGETPQEVSARVGRWLVEHTPVEERTIAVVAHGATTDAAIAILSPDAFARATLREEGCILGMGETWLVEWREGILTAIGPAGL